MYSVKIGKYTLTNRVKAETALDLGGKDESLVLAHYDKMLGQIKDLKGEVVEHGTFWDFDKNAPKKAAVKKVDKKK